MVVRDTSLRRIRTQMGRAGYVKQYQLVIMILGTSESCYIADLVEQQ
jgi:hypothetical protein